MRGASVATPSPRAPTQAAAPRLEIGSVGKTDGHVTLVWTLADETALTDPVFELQTGATPTFDAPRVAYVGPDRASFRSGLLEGTHWYRLRVRAADSPDLWSPWSEPVPVEIRPYALWAAWSVFGIGAVLVGSILVFLFVVSRRPLGGERVA